MTKNITLSKEHGLNPSLMHCPICGKDTGIAVFGKLKGDVKAPTHVIGNEPCDECKDKLNNGKIAIMEVVFEHGIDDNVPRPTGRYAFVDEKAINVKIPTRIAVMRKEEFTEMFEKTKGD